MFASGDSQSQWQMHGKSIKATCEEIMVSMLHSGHAINVHSRTIMKKRMLALCNNRR